MLSTILDMEDKDQLSLIAFVLHLKRASMLIAPFDGEVSSILLSMSKGVLDKYHIEQSSVEEIESIEKEIE